MSGIYALMDPTSGELRYIGKADCSDKRLKGHLRDARRRNTPVYAWIRKLLACGKTPEMVVIDEACSDWKARERELIARARLSGYRLLNLADGGDEPHCPKGVRSSNAKRLNAAGLNKAAVEGDELNGFWDMMRQAGQSIRYFKSVGRLEMVAKLQAAVSRFNGMTREQRVEAGKRWADCRSQSRAK